MAKAFVQLQDKLLALSGEGGGEFVEIRPDIFEEGLTDDDKKINAAAYKKLARGANCILYFTIDVDGIPLKVFVSDHAYDSEYGVFIVMIKPSDFAIMFHLDFIPSDFSDYEQGIEIDENGEILARLKRSVIDASTDNLENKVVILENITDYESFHKAVWPKLQIKEGTEESGAGFGFNIPCVGLIEVSQNVFIGSQLRWVSDLGSSNAIMALIEGPEGEIGFAAGVEGYFTFSIFKNGTIYLSNDEESKEKNKLLFPLIPVFGFHASTFDVVYNFYGLSKQFSILNFEDNYKGLGEGYYEFEICNEGMFYRYRLYPDGSSEQVINQ